MPDLDAYLRCLANQRRRVLLYDLRDRGVTTVDELAATLFDEPHDPLGGGAGDRDEVEAELGHHYLPELDDLSIVDYDARTGTVRVLPYPPELVELLEVTERLDRRE